MSSDGASQVITAAFGGAVAAVLVLGHG